MGEGSGGEIGEHSLGVDSHALVGAVAVFGVWQSLQPGKSGVVDCLSDVVAEIEAAVVAASQDQHELARTLFCLRYLQLRYLAFEKVGIDESGFVPEVLRASAKMLREVFLSLPLQQVRLGFRNGVPKLVLSFVKVVDGGEVEVFLVPAKKSLPGPDVAVGGGHSSHILRDCVPEQRIESVQIPLSASFIHEAADQVCPVERRRKHNALPKLNRLAFTMLYTYSADLPAVSLSKGAAFSR